MIGTDSMANPTPTVPWTAAPAKVTAIAMTQTMSGMSMVALP